jgi:hypothetical protein
METCGTPACMFLGADISPSTETLMNFLWERELIRLIKLIENYNVDNLYSKPRCHVVSQVFSISKNTAALDMLLLKFKVTWSVSLMHWSVMLWWAQKPKWLALCRPLSSVFFWTIFRIIIGRKFWGNFMPYRMALMWTTQRTLLRRIPPLLSDMLNRLLPSDGLGIVDAGACFVCHANGFTARCLAVDDFLVPAVPVFSYHVIILWQAPDMQIATAIQHPDAITATQRLSEALLYPW